MGKRDRAILYGINRYQYISDLRGCRNDVENIQKMLKARFDFKSKNIIARTDRDVVLETLEHDWKWLLKGAEPGARLVFHFSGHGSYVDDENGDETDGVDEILCLYDMKFDNPESYLTDDRIHEWTRELPDDVHLTMIFDCCHSGTLTRQLRPRLRTGRSVRGEELPLIIDDGRSRSRSIREEESPDDKGIKLARFVQPPDEIREKRKLRGIRKRIARSDERLNHVRYSGCRDDQTSADAWIDSDFHGAFSYYFCVNIRDHGADILHTDLIGSVRRSLRGEYDQVPQLAPTDAGGKVFGGPDYRPASGNVAGNVLQGGAGNDTMSGAGAPPVAGDMGRVVSLLEQLLTELRATREGSVAARGVPGPAQNRALVYVHGICFHRPRYSDPWFRALSRHLPNDLRERLEGRENRPEVLWSEHVSSGDREASSFRNDDEQDLAEAIRDALLDRVDQAMELQMSRSGSSLDRNSMERALLGIPGLDCVDDFVKYLLRNRTRQNVIDEFKSVVFPLLQAGLQIDVVAHSWGTVVALEAMHQLEGQGLPGHVLNFFTVGSALSIRLVQRRLKFGAESGAKPSFVRRWVNLDARGDVVGGTLRRFPFSVDEEILNLPAETCRSGLFGPTPACAHSSYFEPENTAVNREIFARFMTS